jgi:lipopolysaccharide/colanic/teichoic acid biosynthesis glycosyltransferase
MVQWAMRSGILGIGLPVCDRAPDSIRTYARAVFKRVLDVALGVTLLACTLPLLGAAMLAIRLTSRGPALFRQQRAGRDGTPFTMYKLRTMYAGAEKDRGLVESLNEHTVGPCFKSQRDPRVTPVGRLLRSTSIDELPQLLNVILGDMSLVGPRPLPLGEVSTATHAERMRLTVKPGLTCLWQISGRTEIPYDEWIMLDLHYVQNRSTGLDLRILLQTIPAVLSGRGAY